MPRWEVGVTAGFIQANPREGSEEPYRDDWYFTGRYAVSAGRFWSRHLETEVEFATTGNGERYTNRYSNVPGVPTYYTVNIRERFRVHQLSGRVVWQFLDNSWVHPYVFGGITGEAERRQVWIPEQYFNAGPDTRNPANRILVSPAVDQTSTTFRAGATAGAGTKVYMSPGSYFNAGFVVSRARPSTTVSFIAGFGWDF